MNKWFQEGNPTSYKIQLLYYEIPKHIKEKHIDTPFRFRTREDALINAKEMYKNVHYRIAGSSDNPHWTIRKKIQ